MDILDRPALLKRGGLECTSWMANMIVYPVHQKQMPIYVCMYLQDARAFFFPQEEYLRWLNESKQDGHNILGYRKALLEGGNKEKK
jgi:hypothetical protein